MQMSEARRQHLLAILAIKYPEQQFGEDVDEEEE